MRLTSLFDNNVETSYFTQLKMCYLMTMFLDHVLTVYSSMEHVTWKSPGPRCGWVGRILHPNSCTSVSSWSKVPLLSIWSVAVPLCRPLFPLSQSMTWFSSTAWSVMADCELHCSPFPWRLGSVYQLWKSPLLSCVSCMISRSCAPSSCKQSRRDQHIFSCVK